MALTQVAFDDTNKRLKRVASPAPDFRAGRAAISSSATTVSVTFSTELPNTNYSLIATWQNTTDTTPQYQPIEITAFSTTGFTLKWNIPTDTANYSINWQVLTFA